MVDIVSIYIMINQIENSSVFFLLVISFYNETYENNLNVFYFFSVMNPNLSKNNLFLSTIKTIYIK